MTTVAQLLRATERRLASAGIEDARLEAEVLVGHALRLTREALLARLQEPTKKGTAAASVALLRRVRHEPAAYITSHREFFGLDLACTPAALIPRPETELLVELALAYIAARPAPALERSEGTRDPQPLVADVGTGSGAIAIAIAVHAPEARVVAVDTSRAALLLARRNARAHGVAGRIDFVQASLLDALRGPFDIVAANLPYIPTRLYRALPPEILDHEPQAALHAGRRGTAVIEALLEQAAARLRPGGLLLAEHAWNQGRRLRDAAHASFPRARIETKRDLAGLERVLVIQPEP